MSWQSVIWRLERGELERLVKQSTTFSEVLRHFGLNHKGGNCRTLKRRLDAEGISYAHIRQGRNSTRGRAVGGIRRPLEEVLCENSNAWRHHLKIRLVQERVLANECAKCGLGPEWNGEPLVLALDHINGVSNDNRRENLRFLCPNCHSQTENFAGRKSIAERVQRDRKYPGLLCRTCNGSVSTGSRSGLCTSCFTRSRRKAERPSREELLRLVDEHGYTGVGRRFGVSEAAIRKWLHSKP